MSENVPNRDAFKHQEDNAFLVLGVSPEASDSELREAYLGKIKEYPKDANSEVFEKIKNAWKNVRDPLLKAAETLNYIDPDRTIAELCEVDSGIRRFAGPKLWGRVIKEED
jgi:hypothetical protein